MFEHFTKYQHILVTGPQRSGTRICARMIAHDTGYHFVDEREIATGSLHVLLMVFANHPNTVVQAPGLCHCVEGIANEKVAIVVMRRNIEDIIASQERIGWIFEPVELLKYKAKAGPVAKVKYLWWEHYQRPVIKHAYEVEYESLSAHPLWIPKEQRGEFQHDQTE